MKIKMLLLAALFTAPAMAVDFDEANAACFHGARFIKAAMLVRNEGLHQEAAVAMIPLRTKNPVAIEEYTQLIRYAYSIPPVRGAAAQKAQADQEKREAYMRCMTAYGY